MFGSKHCPNVILFRILENQCAQSDIYWKSSGTGSLRAASTVTAQEDGEKEERAICYGTGGMYSFIASN